MKVARKFFLSVCFIYFCSTSAFGEVFDSIYGKINIEDSLILDLIKSPCLQRMKEVDQHGTYYFTHDLRTFSRYDHSVGVYYILNRYNVSLLEQAAGLMHDISHTAFSHLGDLIYNHDDKVSSYQDSIHFWYLQKTNLHSVLKNHGYALEDLLYKNGNYTGLEQNLPDLCADRIEYNLHTGYAFHMLSKEDVQIILKDLQYEKGRWFFLTPAIAKKFANLSLYFTENFWGSSHKNMIYRFASQAFQRALNLKEITFDDIHFSTDEKILEKLKASKDLLIQNCLEKCSHVEKHYKIGNKESHNYTFRPKFRGVNPWVKVGDSFVRLTALDLEFALEYQRVKERIFIGHYLQVEDAI